MVQIQITDELADAIAKIGTVAVLVDSGGRAIGHVTPLERSGPIGMTEEHVAELQRRMANDDGTRYKFSDIIDRLRAMAPE
jgi:hypothetical protein